MFCKFEVFDEEEFKLWKFVQAVWTALLTGAAYFVCDASYHASLVFGVLVGLITIPFVNKIRGARINWHPEEDEEEYSEEESENEKESK